MKTWTVVLAALVAVLVVAGCQPQAEVYEAPPTVAFEGKPDPKFVGTWKTADNRFTYTIEADGKYRMKGKVSTQGGSFDTDSSGKWALDGDRLLFQDANGDVSQYRHRLEGETLTLTTTGSLKRDTVLKKQ